eukprot:6957041-Pyramimonas_sp.AAC.1
MASKRPKMASRRPIPTRPQEGLQQGPKSQLVLKAWAPGSFRLSCSSRRLQRPPGWLEDGSRGQEGPWTAKEGPTPTEPQ